MAEQPAEVPDGGDDWETHWTEYADTAEDNPAQAYRRALVARGLAGMGRLSRVVDIGSGRCRDALAGTGLALPPWDPSADDFDIAPDGREIAITADLAPEPAMMNQP